MKAYDSVCWTFLEKMLLGVHFPPHFVILMMSCVTQVTYYLIFFDPFQGKRGLRQGDPLSPYLFVIGLEYLSKMFLSLWKHSDFHVHPQCKRSKIINLAFADDLLVFCRGELWSIQLIKQKFRTMVLCQVYRSVGKRVIYFGGVSRIRFVQLCCSVKEGILLNT